MEFWIQTGISPLMNLVKSGVCWTEHSNHQRANQVQDETPLFSVENEIPLSLSHLITPNYIGWAQHENQSSLILKHVHILSYLVIPIYPKESALSPRMILLRLDSYIWIWLYLWYLLWKWNNTALNRLYHSVSCIRKTTPKVNLWITMSSIPYQSKAC